MKKWKCGNFDHICQLRGYCVMQNCAQFQEKGALDSDADRGKLFCKQFGKGSFVCHTNELGKLKIKP